MKHETDQPTIGLILCKDKVEAEYALRDINKPIGISEYILNPITAGKFQEQPAHRRATGKQLDLDNPIKPI